MSVKLTVVVLLSLAVTSIIGTVVPQNQSPEAYFRAFGAFWYRLFDILDIFDMYHSWWFQLLVILLTVNIVVCSVERLSATWKIIFPGKPAFRYARFVKQKNNAGFDDPRPPDRLKSVCEDAVSGGYRFVHTEDTEEGFRIFAEKGRWSRLGVYVVHVSVVILLMGGLIGSFFGFDGYVNIPEGEAVDHIRMRNSGKILPLDFAIRCNDFNVSFYPSGQPKEYRSSLSLIKGEQVLYEKEIIVNDPLRYQGINIFQSSYGEMPAQGPETAMTAPEEVQLAFTSAATGMVYRQTAGMDQEIDLPEEGGRFVLNSFNPSARFMGQNIGAALQGILTRNPGAEPVEVLLPLRFPNFDKMRRGDIIISVEGYKAEKFVPGETPAAQTRYYTGLQVTKDPGVWVVYTGFILMIAGCFITFFLSHQQLLIEVTRKGGGSRLLVAGVANRNALAMQNKVRRMAKTLSGETADTRSAV